MRRHRTFRMLPALLPLVLALVIAGCGGSEVPVAPPAATTPGAAAPGAVGPDGLPVANPNDPNNPGVTGDATAGLGVAEEVDATLPDLEGGESAAGLPSLVGSGIFLPQAAPLDEQGASADVGAEETTEDIAADEQVETQTTETIAVTYTGATIYLNGQTISVQRRGTFPTGSPIFRLLSVTSSDIEVELIAGKFVANGGTGLFLNRGELRTLANQSEQTTYRIKYLRPVTTSFDDEF